MGEWSFIVMVMVAGALFEIGDLVVVISGSATRGR
jgi:hypothetical protein